MYLIENPVLQRELLVNLRMGRAFVLLFLYVTLLGLVVLAAWPTQERLDLTQAPQEARQLVDLFFIGQYLLAGMMTPSFAAGTITGEKERKTYEMLLASPLRPTAIVLGKLLASLTHLAALIVASLPIAMLCLPLGGVHPYEVLAAYVSLLGSVMVFGAISLTCSSLFKRTAASLVVSYLVILPLALVAVLFWQMGASNGMVRLVVSLTFFPAAAIGITVMLLAMTARRLLRPPDVGSEGKEVVDLEQENREAVGLVIQRDQFPDRLFAPPKRETLMADNANPVYDKEIRSEIFSQGTLMLRLVIQVSMFLALPLMAVCLFIVPAWFPRYVSYVLLFNMLVGPVFCAGAITSERERQTMELLLTTTLSPREILLGKLLVGLRISTVLTSFVLLPVALAGVLEQQYWNATNVWVLISSVVVVYLTCAFTATTAMFCSTLCRRTSVSLMISYLVIIVLFLAPLALRTLTRTVFHGAAWEAVSEVASVTSPFAAVFGMPFQTQFLDPDLAQGRFSRLANASRSGDWQVFWGYVLFVCVALSVITATMFYSLRRRFQVSGR